MYPQQSARGVGPSKRIPTRQMRLQTSFGQQVDSRRQSPAGVVIAELTARNTTQLQTMSVQTTPSPNKYLQVPSCGPQPLSSFMTAARTPLRLTEDRWKPMERVARLNATPSPSEYYPRY